MASKLALMLAAQAWQHEKTRNKEMDSDLAEAFAEILDKVSEQGSLEKQLYGNDFSNKDLLDQMNLKFEKTNPERKENEGN